MNNDLLSMISDGGVLYIALLMALSVHEFGHAYVADKLGDPLPRLDGRVSLNPLAHIDMLGTVILPLIMIFLAMGTNFPMIFGWAKPVRVSLPNSKTRARDDILTTLAGPAMNLIFGFVCMLVMVGLTYFNQESFVEILLTILQINCVLFVFNMLPIPPLDGSRILKYALNMSDMTYAQISRYSLIIILVIINVPQTRFIIATCISFLVDIYILIGNLILSLF
ncbi:MAG: site-2 protease family protein [Opitutales bacterium]